MDSLKEFGDEQYDIRLYLNKSNNNEARIIEDRDGQIEENSISPVIKINNIGSEDLSPIEKKENTEEISIVLTEAVCNQDNTQSPTKNSSEDGIINETLLSPSKILQRAKIKSKGIKSGSKTPNEVVSNFSELAMVKDEVHKQMEILEKITNEVKSRKRMLDHLTSRAYSNRSKSLYGRNLSLREISAPNRSLINIDNVDDINLKQFLPEGSNVDS